MTPFAKLDHLYYFMKRSGTKCETLSFLPQFAFYCKIVRVLRTFFIPTPFASFSQYHQLNKYAKLILIQMRTQENWTNFLFVFQNANHFTILYANSKYANYPDANSKLPNLNSIHTNGKPIHKCNTIHFPKFFQTHECEADKDWYMNSNSSHFQYTQKYNPSLLDPSFLLPSFFPIIRKRRLEHVQRLILSTLRTKTLSFSSSKKKTQ